MICIMRDFAMSGVSVCPSVCLSVTAVIESRQINIRSCGFHRLVAQRDHRVRGHGTVLARALNKTELVKTAKNAQIFDLMQIF